MSAGRRGTTYSTDDEYSVPSVRSGQNYDDDDDDDDDDNDFCDDKGRLVVGRQQSSMERNPRTIYQDDEVDQHHYENSESIRPRQHQPQRPNLPVPPPRRRPPPNAGPSQKSNSQAKEQTESEDDEPKPTPVPAAPNAIDPTTTAAFVVELTKVLDRENNLKNELAATKQQLDDTKEKMENYKRELVQVHEQLQQGNSTSAREKELEAKMARLGLELEDAQGEHERYATLEAERDKALQRERMQKEKTSNLHLELRTLTQQLSEVSKEKDRLERGAREMERELAKLRREIVGLRSTKETVQELQAQYSEAARREIELQKELTEVEEQLNRFRASAQSAVDGKRATERDLRASRVELDRVRRELAGFREEHSETLAKNVQLIDERDNFRREAEEMRQKNAVDQGRLAMLQSQQIGAANDLERQAVQRQMEMEQLQGRIAATRAELVDVKRTREERDRQLAAQAQQMQEQQRMLNTIMDEKENLEAVLGIMEGERHEDQNNIDELQRRLAVLANESMNHEARADGLEHQLEEGRRELEGANEERENDRQERVEVDRQHAEELDGIRTTLDETRQKLAQKERELADSLYSACPICQERQRNIAYRPCGHTVCQQCADQWHAHQQTCASCRQNVTERFRIYMQ